MPVLVEFSAHLPYVSGVPRDVSINTFTMAFSDAVSGDETTFTAALTSVNAAVESFYNGTFGASTVAAYLSNFIDRAHCFIEWALLSEQALGVGSGPVTYTPLASIPFTLDSSSGGTDLPLEFAIVSSLRGGEVFPGAPFPPSIKRRRGRLYLGPFHTGVLVDAADHRPTISHVTQTDLALSTKGLADAVDAIDGVAWVVWSRVGKACSIIDAGYVNDEPDTQRRRGSGETARVSWTV